MKKSRAMDAIGKLKAQVLLMEPFVSYSLLRGRFRTATLSFQLAFAYWLNAGLGCATSMPRRLSGNMVRVFIEVPFLSITFAFMLSVVVRECSYKTMRHSGSYIYE